MWKFPFPPHRILPLRFFLGNCTGKLLHSQSTGSCIRICIHMHTRFWTCFILAVVAHRCQMSAKWKKLVLNFLSKKWIDPETRINCFFFQFVLELCSFFHRLSSRQRSEPNTQRSYIWNYENMPPGGYSPGRWICGGPCYTVGCLPLRPVLHLFLQQPWVCRMWCVHQDWHHNTSICAHSRNERAYYQDHLCAFLPGPHK